MDPLRSRSRLDTLLSICALALAAAGCGASAPVVLSSEGSGTMVTAGEGFENIVFGAMEIREHQRLGRDLFDRFARLHVDPTFRLARDTRDRNIESLNRLLRGQESFEASDMPPAGHYDDAAMQAEFDRLAAQGAESPAAACRVGALIEERDLALIRERARETMAADVTRLYTRLDRAGREHLFGFVSRLRSMGERYTPGEMRSAELNEQMESSLARGDVSRER